MLRLKVEKLVQKLRRNSLEEQFQNNREMFMQNYQAKFDNNLFFENLIENLKIMEDKFDQTQIMKIYDYFYENSDKLLNKSILTKFAQVCIQINNTLFYVILNALCHTTELQHIKIEQQKLYPYLVQVIQDQDIELIDLAIDGIFQLLENNVQNFRSKELLDSLIHLINLQLNDIDIDQVCFIIQKSISQIEIEQIELEKLPINRFIDSLLFYLSRNEKSIINLLLKFFEFKVEIQQFFDQCFYNQLWQIFDYKYISIQINILYLMKQILLCSCHQYLIELDFTVFIDQTKKLEKSNQNLQKIIYEIYKILEQKRILIDSYENNSQQY